jgi:hypothetical protein
MINPIIPIERLALMVLLALPLAGWLAWRSSSAAGAKLRGWLIALRVVGVLLLAVAAFNPGHRERQREADSTTWGLMLDNSASMAQADVGGGTRLEAAERLARAALKASADAELVRTVTFADSLQSVEDGYKQITIQPGDTDIARSGRELLSEFAGTRRLRGILLLSDGRQVDATAADTLALHAQAQGAPLYAVSLGGPVTHHDFRIRSQRRQYIAFKGQPVRVDARINGQGAGPSILPVQLLGADGKILAEQQVSCPGEGADPAADGDSTQVVTFELDPLEPGRHICTFQLGALQDDHAAWNNRDEFEVVVLEHPVATLHVEGLPYWDSKFLMQLLRQQPNLAVESIYRVGENRFFKVESDIQDSRALDDHVFPETLEALARYDMVILGKGCEYFLTPGSIRALRAFVRDLGGALVFSRGKPYHGTLPDLEPLEAGQWGSSIAADLQLQPTVTGEDMGLFGRLLPGRDDPVWSSLPPIRHAHAQTRLHSFTRVLASGSLGGGSSNHEVPLITGRRYGKGMVVTVNADGIWQWGFMPSVDAAGPLYGELWAQLLNWTITYGEFLPGEDLAIRLSQTTIAAEGTTHVQIHHRPTSAETPPPTLEIIRDGEPVGTCSLASHVDNPLRWDGMVSLSQPGSYRLCVQTGDAAGPEQALTVVPKPDEHSNESADPDYLARLCAATGGRLISPDEVADTVRQFEAVEQEVQNVESKWDPLWDTPLYLLLLMVPFGLEWFLRRRHGLL